MKKIAILSLGSEAYHGTFKVAYSIGWMFNDYAIPVIFDYSKIINHKSIGSIDVLSINKENIDRLSDFNHIIYYLPLNSSSKPLVIPYDYDVYCIMETLEVSNKVLEIIKGADRVLVPTEYTKKNLERLFDIKVDRVLPHGYFGSVYYPLDIDRSDVFLSVSRLDVRKNLTYLFLIQPYINKKWIHIGIYDWQQKTLFNHMKDIYHADVELLDMGFIPSDDELNVLYNQCKVYVLPSGAEGFSLTLLEAMATHTPAVTLNIPNIVSWLGDAGYYINTKCILPTYLGLISTPNIEDMIIKIKNLFEDEELYKDVADRQFEYVQNFNLDNEDSMVYQCWNDYVSEVIGK